MGWLECWGEDLVHKRPEPVNQLQSTKKGLCSHLSLTQDRHVMLTPDRHVITAVAMEQQEAPLTGLGWAAAGRQPCSTNKIKARPGLKHKPGNFTQVTS